MQTACDSDHHKTHFQHIAEMKGAETRKMFPKFPVCLFLITIVVSSTASGLQDPGFVYNGFKNADISEDGIAQITDSGLLMLTNNTRKQKGHAFYQKPFVFKNSSNGNALSFSTSFVFAIVPQYPDFSSHGIAFVVAPSKGLPGSFPNQYLGLFNKTNNGNSSNHVFAVELDTVTSSEFGDINENHVGIDINSLESVASAPAMYYVGSSNGSYKNLTLISGQPMQIWIEYDGFYKKFHVTIAPIDVPKPRTPLLSKRYDISSIFLESMYVGFSSSTGSIITSHYILGWSFQMNGKAQAIDLSRLPKLPRRGPKQSSKITTVVLPIICPVFVLILMCTGLFMIRRLRKYEEIIEDWERNYGTHRFSYKDLYIATNGFREKHLLGIGGFGRVYKGVLPSSKIEIAVKKVSHESRQGIKEFITEIVSLGQLRHRNLVQLLGYCRRKGELFLVYDFMCNGSLDKLLFNPLSSTLNWSQRFKIIKGVASGLVYLHEEWEQVIIHRDIKAGNVLLDGEFNARLGDFGLARLYDHGTNPQTTHLVGTLGYLAPEMIKTGKATTATDVYAFGAFMLEVACGRRPLASDENLTLVDWVISCWSRGVILETTDPNLGNEYQNEEMELVLKLGVLCSRAIPRARPSMRQVVQFLEKSMPLPQLSSQELNAENLAFEHSEEFDDVTLSYTSLEITNTTISPVAESPLSSGR